VLCIQIHVLLDMLLWLYFSMEQNNSGVMTHQHLMEVIDVNGEPFVLKNMIADWPASGWTPENLHMVFKNEPLSFRIGNSCYGGMA